MANAGQAEFWNAEPGRNWVTFEAELDAQHREITARLLAAAAAQPGERVLDIGCGAGGSTLALAAAIGPAGRIDGIDLSAPLLERARARADALGLDNARFHRADAQEHGFEPGAYDLAVSRFGVMFFDDPVAAFGNVARALRPGGRLSFVAWAGPEANPWFALPVAVAAARLGPLTPTPPEAPGPMAFRDTGRVLAILAAAGFVDADAASSDVTLHNPGGIEAAMRLFANLGALPRFLREKEASAADREAILADLRAALDRFRADDGLRIPARVTLFSARAAG